MELNEYNPKSTALIHDSMEYFFKKNKGYNVKSCAKTNLLTNNNSTLAFSTAVNLRNGRVLLIPFEEQVMKLFNMADGSVVQRQTKGNRYIGGHHLHHSTAVFIPADSNKAVLIYDVNTAEEKFGKPCQINGDMEFKDIFATSILLPSGEVLCVNKNFIKSFLYNPFSDKWEGVDFGNDFHMTEMGSGCVTTDGSVLLTNRRKPEDDSYCLQLYKNKRFSKLPFEVEKDEFIGCVPDKDNVVWLIPFKGTRLVRLDLKTMTHKEWDLGVQSDLGISMGGCILPNGNLFISAYGIEHSLEVSLVNFKATMCPVDVSSGNAFLNGALLMCNGLVFCPPYYRKTGVVYGTEVFNASVDLFINQLYNTNK